MFSFAKKVEAPAAEIAALKSQLDSARRRITELTLENIQQANEIIMLKEYRGVPAPEVRRPILATGKEMTMPSFAANSEIGLLFSAAG